MDKPALSSYFRQRIGEIVQKKQPGPYLTVSRQYGCDGLELAGPLVEKLNQRDEQRRWKLYHKELLKQLAEDTGLTEEIIEKERLSKPSLLKDFLRGLLKSNVPDGYEIRKSITMMVRTVAFEGYAVIIGQGGNAATTDLDNGLNVRIEAPKEWRVARISVREQLSKEAAAARMEEIDAQRHYLQEIYEKQNPRQPAFHLLLDNSMFSKEQIAELILLAMEKKGLIPQDALK
ncbi:MAG: cytidylate kinase-like family protein [Planctomycetes bacterium]|nr:cytidylate kinase-like family protein [Planctomycetota bacterium]